MMDTMKQFKTLLVLVLCTIGGYALGCLLGSIDIKFKDDE